jgi:ribosome maturation factor RimP
MKGGMILKKADIERICEELVTPIIEAGGYELVDVEYVKEGSDYYLRVYADKEGGITIDDCVEISRALEAKLDEKDFIEEAYILEVSSPGLTRPLKKEKDFKRSLGRLVDLKLYKAVNGQKEYEGRLAAFDENTLQLTVNDETVTINRNDISMIRLAFED